MQPYVSPGALVDERYQVVRHIGRGGMADVFEALDLATGTHVALKILHRALARDADARARFDAEGRVLTRVQHPNVVVFHAAGMADSVHPYLIVELLRGRSLAHVLDEEPRLHYTRACNYVWQALQGLHATHGLGVLHRDLKPGNLMLEPTAEGRERVVVIDYGFAAFDGGTGITQPGYIVGSISYLAPERLKGKQPDARADIYSMGVVLYECVTGRRPFTGDENAIVHGHLDAKPPPPTRVAPDAGIPAALEAVVLRALAKKPSQRPQSAAQMAFEIANAVGWR